MIILKPVLINKKNFKKFGNVISVNDKKGKVINNGYATKFSNLVNLNAFKNQGSPAISIFKAKKRKFPLTIDHLEMHPLSSQAFIPLKNRKFICCVCPINKKPDLKKIKAFIIPEDYGIVYNKKVWHFPLISTDNMNFLVIERIGKFKNLERFYFNETIKLKL